MTDGSPKSGLPVDLVGTLSDGCQPFFAFLALKKLDNHLGGHGRFDAATMQAEVSELTPFETSIKMGLNDSTTK